MGNQAGVEEPAAVVQESAAQPEHTGETNNADQQGEERQVPVSVLNAMRDELKTLKEQNSLYQTQLAQNQTPQPAQPENVQQNNVQIQDPLANREPDDLISVADVRKILETTQQTSQLTSQQIAAQLSEVSFKADNPDYKQVLEGLKNTMANNPELSQMLSVQIQASPNPLQAAYAFAKAVGVNAQQTQQPQDVMSELDRILANKEKPASPSQVSGGTGGTLSGGSKFDKMSPEDFEQHLLAVKQGRA